MDELLGLVLPWIYRVEALVILGTAVVCIRRAANPLTALMLLGAVVVALVQVLDIFVDVAAHEHLYFTTVGTNAVGHLFFVMGVCLLCLDRTAERATAR